MWHCVPLSPSHVGYKQEEEEEEEEEEEKNMRNAYSGARASSDGLIVGGTGGPAKDEVAHVAHRVGRRSKRIQNHVRQSLRRQHVSSHLKKNSKKFK
jgi:hypothetical protein